MRKYIRPKEKKWIKEYGGFPVLISDYKELEKGKIKGKIVRKSKY